MPFYTKIAMYRDLCRGRYITQIKQNHKILKTKFQKQQWIRVFFVQSVVFVSEPFLIF